MYAPLIQIDAFAEALFEGNPAAVVPLERWLDDAILQRVALENNLSETAFVVSDLPEEAGGVAADVPAYHLRWFTPAIEVDLCGHATLATASYLFESVHPDVDGLRFWTRSGWLTVARHPDGYTMDFPSEPLRPVEVDPALVSALGVPVLEALQATDLVYVVQDAAVVEGLRPDLTVIGALPVRGLVVTAPGGSTGFDFVSRWFGALAGVAEDPVTGSAHSQIAPYWAERLGKTTLRARQLSVRGGTVLCEVSTSRVSLTGTCVRYLEGRIQIPTTSS